MKGRTRVRGNGKDGVKDDEREGVTRGRVVGGSIKS